MKLSVSAASGTPIYAQLKDQLKAAILNGDLEAGQALPSLRTVARELRISVLTVTRAYSELEREGYVINMQGKGCYVQSLGNALLREQLLRQAEERMGGAIAAARQAGLEKEEIHDMLDILWTQEEN